MYVGFGIYQNKYFTYSPVHFKLHQIYYCFFFIKCERVYPNRLTEIIKSEAVAETNIDRLIRTFTLGRARGKQLETALYNPVPHLKFESSLANPWGSTNITAGSQFL